MTGRELDAWGGEVRMPRVLRRLLRRPDPPGDTPEAAHEARKPAAGGPSVLANADKAAMGALTAIYAEGRAARRR